jgi:hypothetical protein
VVAQHIIEHVTEEVLTSWWLGSKEVGSGSQDPVHKYTFNDFLEVYHLPTAPWEGDQALLHMKPLGDISDPNFSMELLKI